MVTPVVTCRHCSLAKVNRPRGLCRVCYHAPGVRGLYPPTSKYAHRGVGNVCGNRPPPDAPTAAAPGTEEKMAVLAERARLGFSLWHPLDARHGDTGQGADDVNGLEPSANGTAEKRYDVGDRPASCGDCPDCGRPFGKIRRCFHCKPAAPKGGAAKPRTTVPAVPAPLAPTPAPAPVVPPASAVREELTAMGAMVEVLEEFTPAAAARITAWLASRFAETEG